METKINLRHPKWSQVAILKKMKVFKNLKWREMQENWRVLGSLVLLFNLSAETSMLAKYPKDFKAPWAIFQGWKTQKTVKFGYFSGF